jgi:hypothetical protein
MGDVQCQNGKNNGPFFIECRSQMVSTPASYFVAPGLESEPGDWLLWLKFCRDCFLARPL